MRPCAHGRPDLARRLHDRARVKARRVGVQGQDLIPALKLAFRRVHLGKIGQRRRKRNDVLGQDFVPVSLASRTATADARGTVSVGEIQIGQLSMFAWTAAANTH